MLQARDYGDVDDLRRMQRLVAQIWRKSEGPPVSHHVGDLPWRRFSISGREHEFPTRLWEENGAIVAWAWLTLPDELEVVIAPGRRAELLDDAVTWADARAGCAVKVDWLDADAELRTLLVERGFELLEEDVFYSHARTLATLPEPAVPAGFKLRHVQLPEDLEQRVRVHRASFGTAERPSRMTTESYAAAAAAWPYRPELDWVVEAPDGSFAASCLIWLDEENRVAELEPVGTDARYRRLGLASAACIAAMRAAHARRAETAIVMAVSDEARGLYRAIGFEEVGRYTWFARPFSG